MRYTSMKARALVCNYKYNLFHPNSFTNLKSAGMYHTNMAGSLYTVCIFFVKEKILVLQFALKISYNKIKSTDLSNGVKLAAHTEFRKI